MSWNLASMRGDMSADDPLGGLGPRVEPTPPPAPAPVSRGDGFLVHPDGTLSTDIEPPSGPPPAPAPADPDDDYPPIPAEAPPWPFPQVVSVRVIAHPAKETFRPGAIVLCVHSEGNAGLIPIPGQPGEGIYRFPYDEKGKWWEPIASAPAPLKVGDKVRLIGESWVPECVGEEYEIKSFGSHDCLYLVDHTRGGHVFVALGEGREWERA